MIRFVLLLMVLLFAGACVSKVKNISTRDLSDFDRDGQKYVRYGRPGSVEKKPPEVFIRNRDVRIEYVTPENTSGSLFRPDDARNYLFTTYSTPGHGGYLTVRVVNHNSLPEEGSESGEETQKPGGQDKAADGGGENNEEDLEEDKLLKSLPHLEPDSFNASALVDQMRMKVIHQFQNGDLLLSWERSSSGSEDARVMQVQARLPYRQLSPSEAVTTKDLTDVHIMESHDGEILEKKSTGWQDEYTMRISGFDEAKSKMAAALEGKRQEILKVRENVRNRLKSLGSERRQWAKERDTWIKEREADRRKVADAEKSMEEQKSRLEEQKSTIDEQSNTIREQQQQIEELSRPEEKPDEE